MKRSLPIGISDFKRIIEDNYYYVDKTSLISSILKDGAGVKLFTRPRRFGKTLNVSMIKYFFDIEKREENRKLFEGLDISKSKYFEKHGTAQVISISCRKSDEKNWEVGFRRIKTEIGNVYSEFKFLMDVLDKKESKKFEDIWLEKDEADWKNSLLNLSKYLYSYYGKKVIILIDEYDQPIIDSYVKGYYGDAINFFKSFYGCVLKDNSRLKIGILTGILRVAKENIFSGLNNLEVHTILDDRFTGYFGLLEEEVEQALKDFGLESELSNVQKWYNGYLFGNTKVYNPWSIISFLNRDVLKPYCVNTSKNELIKECLKKCKNEKFPDFSKLLNKKTILKRINDNITFCHLEFNYPKNIWNLFFHRGYLTLSDKITDDVRCNLKIPNEEILKMFSETFIEIYFDDYDMFLDMTDALKDGNIELFQKNLKEVLLENAGIFDLSGKYKEQFYHGLLLGIMLVLKNEYEITSNNFSGKGRYDLLLKPKDLKKQKEGIVIEVKIVNLENEKNVPENKVQEILKKECELALRQIEEMEYCAALKNAGIDNFLKIGIAFYGKEVEVAFKNEEYTDFYKI